MIGVHLLAHSHARPVIWVRQLFMGMGEEERKDILESALSNAGHHALEGERVLDLVDYLERCHDLLLRDGPDDDFSAAIKSYYEDLSNFKWVARHDD